MRARQRDGLKALKHATLAQLETLFGPALPASLFSRNTVGPNSRRRLFTPGHTFWSFLWQSLNPKSSCREVVRQLIALCGLHARRAPSHRTGAFCRARRRLSAGDLAKALSASAQAAQRLAPPAVALQGRPVKVTDGSGLTLADSAKNQAAFPQVANQKPGCGFPLLRLVVLFCLRSGTILASAHGSQHQGELRLFQKLFEHLQRGDIVVGDRGFGYYVVVALLAGLGVDFIGRSTRRFHARRRQQKLGPGDWRVLWQKPSKVSALLSRQAWQALPVTHTLRVVRGRLHGKGFRVREVTLVTTLLDAKLYPAQEILEAYRRRWRLEMCLDDLKTSLAIETLRCQTPEMVEKELRVALIAHNLIRWTMATAAQEHGVALERISFKGSVDAVRQFALAMSQARRLRQRRELWRQLLRVLAADEVPLRPDRREPRAVKRRKNKYPRLNQSRRCYRDRIKRNERRRRTILRAKGLK
jgi:hypothetical protein